MISFQRAGTVFRREMRSYFSSPVAYVFLVAFLLLTGFLTFSVSQFYERGDASLVYFFMWHPWVYLLLVPAATMGAWSEERRSGTIELLLTLPITLAETLVGKFLAAWAFIAIALALTCPIIFTTAWLGSPDMGAIFCGYFGSLLMAGACVAVGMLASALTRSQVVAFVLALACCLVLILAGFEPVTRIFSGWAPQALVDGVAACSLMTHFDALQRGVVDLRDVVYFASVMVLALVAAHVAVDCRKAS